MSKLNIKLLGPCLLAIAIDAMGFGLVYPIMAAIFSDPQSGIIGADGRSITLSRQTSLYVKNAEICR